MVARYRGVRLLGHRGVRLAAGIKVPLTRSDGGKMWTETDVTEQPEIPSEPEMQRPPQAAPLAMPARSSHRNTWLAMGSVLVALLLLMFIPGSEEYDPTAPPPAASGPAEVDQPTSNDTLVGKQAPLQFTMKDMNGVDVQLSSFKGKVVLLNFWATWCGPCQAEIPDLVKLQAQYRDDLVILGVSVDDTPDKMQPYAAEYKINYPLLIGAGRTDVLNAYGPILGLPSTFIIGRDGIVTKKHSGMATGEQFESEVKPLIDARAGSSGAANDL
ncbi:MAG: TlpA family protein disulfide reductase [Acidobacteria bacterium]|nr:TlpA family protein disulfide reductase [Acidobacteriota bacterium]